MKFSESKKMLLQIFDKNNFKNDVKNNRTHTSCHKLVSFSNGTKISISFPGYKAKINKYGLVYDYRVDIQKNNITTSLSHANIITDIFNKIVYGKMDANKLKNFLIHLSKEGPVDIELINKELQYTSILPHRDLISRVKLAHGNKQYNHLGNSFDLTIEELLSSIKWIVLQEDINYPISKGFERRKMPFSRYLEIIHVAQTNSHSLEEVINRALAHNRPNTWDDIDYSFTKFIL